MVVPHAVDDHRMQGDHGGLEPGRAADIAFANKAAADYQAEAATAVFLALIVVQIELDLGVLELADGFVEILGIPSPENVPAHQPAQFPVAQGNGVRVGLAFQSHLAEYRLEHLVSHDGRVAEALRDLDDEAALAVPVLDRALAPLGYVSTHHLQPQD